LNFRITKTILKFSHFKSLENQVLPLSFCHPRNFFHFNPQLFDFADKKAAFSEKIIFRHPDEIILVTI